MRPSIGVFPQYDRERRRWFLCDAYVKSLCEAGAEPKLLFTVSEESFRHTDGFLFPGGPDVNPMCYGEEVLRGCGDICTERDLIELEALRKLCEIQKPVLGICRGVQVMNVALGGTLHQDITSTIQHYQVAGDDVAVHEVLLEHNSILYECLGVPLVRTNSFHHQCVAKPAERMHVCGRTRDGVIEALELTGHPFFVGVQWHPEHMKETGARIFASFVAHC